MNFFVNSRECTERLDSERQVESWGSVPAVWGNFDVG